VPGLFDHEVAFSDRPPLLTDFWDDAVSADGTQPVVRKVVRIRVDIGCVIHTHSPYATEYAACRPIGFWVEALAMLGIGAGTPVADYGPRRPA